MSRLQILSSDLMEKLRSAPPEKLRAATLAACEFAVHETSVENGLVNLALVELRDGKVLQPREKAAIADLTGKLDQEYFDLQDAAELGKATKEDYLRAFARARAVAAVSSASKENAFEAAQDAVYEAAFSVPEKDTGQLFALVEAALR